MAGIGLTIFLVKRRRNSQPSSDTTTRRSRNRRRRPRTSAGSSEWPPRIEHPFMQTGEDGDRALILRSPSPLPPPPHDDDMETIEVWKNKTIKK